MLGAIAGDFVGSIHEVAATKRKDFRPLIDPLCRFTDDTVLTVAVAEVLLDGGDYAEAFDRYARAYPKAGYGDAFKHWVIRGDRAPYGSFGNGSAMRVSPVGWAFPTLEATLDEAARSASVTHDHPEGIKGAQAVAAAVFLARRGAGKEAIKAEIAGGFDYDLDRTLDEIRPRYCFEVSCQRSVPESIIAFLESKDYEDAVRGAISLGGDADTMACIAGAIAEAHYGSVPEPLRSDILAMLPDPFPEIIGRFSARFGSPG